jgi:hypothetical protein
MKLLYESIPHLAAGLFGHILGTAWAAYRVEDTLRLTHLYRGVVVPKLCAEQDFLKTWWNQRRSYAVRNRPLTRLIESDIRDIRLVSLL